jgi:predicted  nucleic acid-binding Zn-ribbon protein
LTQEQKEIAVLTAAIQQMSKFRGAEAQAMETAWGQWQKIRIAYREMLITLGQALLPLVKSVAPVVVNLFKSISTGVLHLQIFYLEQKKKIQKEALKDLEGWRNWHKLFGLFFKSSREKVKLYEEAIKAQRERIAETGKEIAKLREQLGKGTAAYSEALESLEKAEKFAGKIGAHQKGLADNLSKLLEKTKDSKKKVREEVRKSATHFVEFASLFERITGGFERTPLPIEKTTLSLGNFAKKLNTSSLFLKGLAVPIEKVRTATGGLTEQVQAMTSMLSEEELWISKVLNRFEEMAGYMVEVLPTVSETLTSFYSQHQEGLMRLGSATRVFTLGMRESLRELAAAFVDYLVNKISVAMLEIMAEKVKNIFILIAKGLAGELTAFARIPLLLAEFASTLAALAAIKAAASALKGSIRKMQFGGWVSTPFALAEKGEFVLPRPTAEKFLRFLEIVGERYYKIETPRIINITINTSAAWNTQELESLARKVSRLLR